MGKTEEKRPLGRHRRRLEDNIKMELEEVDVKSWIGSIWIRKGTSGGTNKCGNETSCSINRGEFLD
jgi:hypothetical protein